MKKSSKVSPPQKPKKIRILRQFYLEHNGIIFRFETGDTWLLDRNIEYPGDPKTKTLSPQLIEEYKNDQIFEEI